MTPSAWDHQSKFTSLLPPGSLNDKYDMHPIMMAASPCQIINRGTLKVSAEIWASCLVRMVNIDAEAGTISAQRYPNPDPISPPPALGRVTKMTPQTIRKDITNLSQVYGSFNINDANTKANTGVVKKMAVAFVAGIR